MRRIRLQVRIEPLEAPSSPSAPSGSRQEKILPWTEPCSEDLPISELWAKIEARFERIYPGRGRLRIKYLQDHYGSVLDTTETVGDIFDDRTGGAELNATSIVRVVRFPPDREELNNPQRFGSIMPESFARPQKRFLSNIQPTVPSNLREMAILEDLEASQVGGGYGRADKRQRLQEATMSKRFDPDRPVHSRERDCGETPQRRISPVRQASPSHLIEDSQRPLAPGRSSPYGTPTSLSLIDRTNHTSFGTANQDGIPDSPPGKTNLQSIVDLDDDDTKSESPDLGRSLYEVPLSHAGTPAAVTEIPTSEAAVQAVPPAAGTDMLYPEAADHILPVSIAASSLPEVVTGALLSKDTPRQTQPARLHAPQPPTFIKDFAEGLSKPKQSPGRSLPRNPPQGVSKSRNKPYDMYDPIETDTANSLKPQGRPNSWGAKLRSNESVQLPPFNHVRKPLTTGDMRPPSLGTDEPQSSATYAIQGNERPFRPLDENVHRESENIHLQASSTKVRTLMEPPNIASLDVIGKHQESSHSSSSQLAKPTEEPRYVIVHQERPVGDVSDQDIQGKAPITLENKTRLPEEQLSEELTRPTQRPKDDAQQERLDRKRKREEAEIPSNTKLELGRVEAMPEEHYLVLQAKVAGDLERSSKAYGIKAKEEKAAEQQKVKEAQVKEKNTISERKEATEAERTEETKAKETKVKEQKTKILEKDAKRLKTEQTAKFTVRQDAAKQKDERKMRTRTPGRNDSKATKNRRAELAIQKARELSESGRPKSSTPLSSAGIQETNTISLTAFYPGSGGSRSSSLSIEHPSPLQETPSKGTKAGEQPPLTSALRKSPNPLRRSVSSISWANPIVPPDISTPAKPPATAPNPSGAKRAGSSPITSASVAASHTRQPSVVITRTSSHTSVDTSQKKSRDPPKNTSMNTKKQTRLNVKGDFKQKGRVIDPPSPPKPAVEETLVISSDGDDTVSSYFSDLDENVQETCTAKAGPSSKKKAKSDVKLATAKAVITPKTRPNSHGMTAQHAPVKQATPTIEGATSSRQAEAVATAKTLPGSQDITARQQGPVKQASLNTETATGSQHNVATDTQSRASSRSPARYVSSTPSTTSSSRTKSDASDVSSSPPDITPEHSSQAPLEMKSTSVESRSFSSSLKPEGVKTTLAADRRLSSQSSGTPSTQQSQNTDAMSVESALDQQLQRESRQFSEPAQIQVKSSPPTTRSQALKSNSQMTPSEYQYTMSGPRSTNIRFPSLSKLKNKPPKYDPKEHLKHASFLSSQKRDDPKPVTSSQTNGVTHDDESSSDSDDESDTSSDNDNNSTKAHQNPFSSPVGSQLSKKSDGRNAKGLSSLFKLAKRHGVNG